MQLAIDRKILHWPTRIPESKKPNLQGWAKCLNLNGADDRNRTGDIRIMNAQKRPFIGVDIDSVR